jgi:predicted secreted protein
MVAQKGENVILKIGDGATPTEVFTGIGGLISTGMKLNNEIISANNLSSGKYRSINSQTGIASLSINGRGYFLNSTSEEVLRECAFMNTDSNFQLHFGNGDMVSGAFVVSEYQRLGSVNSQEDFLVVLESSGNVNFTKSV